MNFYTRSSNLLSEKTKGFTTNYLNQKIVRTMKIFVFLMTILCVQVSANAFSQRINISQKNVPLVRVLKEIKRQTGYFFLYDTDLVQQKSRPVTIDLKNAELSEVLTQTLKSQPFGWEIKDNTILIFPKSSNNENLKAIDVTGKIVDENGNPMPGASVRVKGQSASTVSDINGNFTIRNVDENAVLVISYIGYTDREIAAKSQMGAVKLSPSAGTLSDVVVTGYTNYTKTQSAAASSLVSADKINDVVGLTLDQILQGRVPGMSVISSSGQPGQSATTVIRGIGSINGSTAPLYVLDGVPIESNYFQAINPEDIESATVLKDASAKALYGSRGSNGVIVLVSKKGKAGRVSVNYSSQYGFSNLSRPNFVMMNTEQRLQFEEEIGVSFNRNLGPGWVYSPKNPNYTSGTPAFRQRADFILDSLRQINTDWRDEFFQKGKFQEQQVSISGGNEKVRFYNSLNYYDQEGVAKRTGQQRYALRSNLDFNDGKFSGSTNLSIGYSQSSFTENVAGTANGSAMASVYYALPYEQPYVNGTLIHLGNRTSSILDTRTGSQGLERLQNSSNKTDQLKTIISTSFAYQILPELKVTTRAGIDYRNSNDVAWINPDSYYGSRSSANTLGGKGRLDEANRRNFNLISTTGLTYGKVFNEVHDFEVSAFYEYVYNNFSAISYTGFGLDGRLPETPAAVSNTATFLPSVGGSKTKNALASIMAVARYTYNDKYTLIGSYRYDGSTRVAPDNKWHGFYSVGANWNVKKEDFLKDNTVINDLRLRASYGITASPFGSDFGYLAAYAANTAYGNVAGIRPTSPGNPGYDWEYVNESNAGFDLNMLKNRLRISADVYYKKTSNMFIDQPLSATSGFSTLSLSAGIMSNKGVEFDVSGDVLKTNDFIWTLGINAGYNRNRILHLTDQLDTYADGDTRVLKVGYPIGTYIAPDWAGVNPQTGEAQYYNLDGSITTTYNLNTQGALNSGSLYPTFTGGISTSLSYKGITASALLSFVSNVMRWNNEDFYTETQRYATDNQSVRMLENRWKNPGDSGDKAILQRFDIPRVFTSKDIQDASFLRLRNLNIGYAIPKHILEKTKFIKGVKIFVQGQNLFTWTNWKGLDPENNAALNIFQYPNTRTYTAGLNVNF